MQDFTKGSVLKQLTMFSIPMLLANFFQAIYSIIAGIWVGRLIGHEAFAAVSTTMPVVFLVVSAIIGLAVATNILVGQAFGANDNKYLAKVLTNSFISTGALCLMLSILGMIFTRQLLRLVNVPENIENLAYIFLFISFAGMPLQFIYNWFSGILRGLGDAKTPLYLIIVSTVLNIVLAPLFILGLGPLPKLGLAGAAISGIVATIIMLFIAYYFVLQKHVLLNITKWDYALDYSIIKKIFVIGIPASLQMVITSLSAILVVSLVNSFGVNTTAAYGIGVQLNQLTFMPSMAIGMAISSIAAQNIGAGLYTRVRETTRLSVLFSVGFALFFFVIIFSFPKTIASMFTTDAEVLAKTEYFLRIVSFNYFAFSIMFALQGVVRAAGDTMYMLIFSIAGIIITQYPLAYYLSQHTPLKENGIWISMAISPLVGLSLNYWYYKSGRWQKQIISNPSR
ncbi:MAG: MATE family efflux transporter [Elusimicrobiota bacterium]